WRATHNFRALVRDLMESARWSPYLTTCRVFAFLGRRASRVIPRPIRRWMERMRERLYSISTGSRRIYPAMLLPELLDYTGEFGPELVLFNPFCRWLAKEGLLKNRRIRTYRGMRCFYDDLDCLEIIEKAEPRRYVPPNQRPEWLPIKNEHNFDNLGRT